MPQACLVGRDHRTLEVLLQHLEKTDAAEARATDENAVGARRACRTDLRIERFDLLRETHAVGVQVAGRDLAPVAARIVAQMAHHLEAVFLVIGQRRGDR